MVATAVHKEATCSGCGLVDDGTYITTITSHPGAVDGFVELFDSKPSMDSIKTAVEENENWWQMVEQTRQPIDKGKSALEVLHNTAKWQAPSRDIKAVPAIRDLHGDKPIYPQDSFQGHPSMESFEEYTGWSNGGGVGLITPTKLSQDELEKTVEDAERLLDDSLGISSSKTETGRLIDSKDSGDHRAYGFELVRGDSLAGGR